MMKSLERINIERRVQELLKTVKNRGRRK